MTILIPLLIKDIILAAFCQTLFFVSTNKVSTAQYFMWYITFTPIVLSNLKLNKYTKCYGIALLSAWALLQYIWNRLSYRLEYLDEVHLFISLWLICLAFYLVNILILIFIMRNDEYNNYYVPSNTPETDRPYPVLKHSEDESSAIENMKKTQDITFGNLRYVHRKGRRGVELHTITKIDKWGIHKLFSTFSPVYLLVSIVSLAFLAFKALSTTLSKVIVVFLATVCLCCVVAISVDPIEASLLHIPNTGLMVRCSNSLRKSEKFIHSLETCSILVVERFYRFRITYGLIAVVKNDCIFYVDKLSEKKLSPQHASDLHLTQDDIYGHSTSCKLLSHDLDIIPLFPVSLSCMKFMVSIWRSLNVHPDKSVAPNAANVSECDVTKRLDSPPPQ